MWTAIVCSSPELVHGDRPNDGKPVRSARDDIGSGVALTSLLVAAGRAVDTHRPDGLINDPFAEAFVLAAHLEPPMQTRPVQTRPVDPTGSHGDDGPTEEEAWQMMSGYMGVRTRFFDEVLDEALADGCRQVVLLTSGLDARAFRLAWPAGTTLFELDQGPVLDFKRHVLRENGAVAGCDQRYVSTDLGGGWSQDLLDAGFAPAEPTVWLAEGLLPYLSASAQDSMLQTVTSLSAPGSRWGVEDFAVVTAGMTDPTYQRLARRFGLTVLDEVLRAERHHRPATWLRKHGWRVDTELVSAVSARYGRVLGPLTQRINGPVELITAASR